MKNYPLSAYIDDSKVMSAQLQLSEADRDAFEALPNEPEVAQENQKTVRVFDTVAQEHFTVRRAVCPSTCFCAAEIVNYSDSSEPKT